MTPDIHDINGANDANDANDANIAYETVFVARQAVFDREMSVWGYKLLYRDSDVADSAVFSDELEATLKVMANVTICPLDSCTDTSVLVNFPEESILVNAPYAMPVGNTIVQLDEALDTPRYFVESVSDLKDSGYKIAVDNFGKGRENTALCHLADYIVIDMRALYDVSLEDVVQSAKKYDCRLIAKKIETHESFEQAKALGFSYFNGYFFKKPKLVQGRTLASTDAARLKLFQVVKGESPDFEALAQAIEFDVSISYRLLSFLNSPSFGFRTRVTSIRQAVVLAGWKQMKNWLRLIILTDMPASDKAKELSFLAAQRAKFLELASVSSGRADLAESLFLLGLFSLLSPMLDLPMKHILEQIFLDDELKAALSGDENRFSPWIKLAQSIEEVDWGVMDKITSALGLVQEELDRHYREAITWTNAFFSITS